MPVSLAADCRQIVFWVVMISTMMTNIIIIVNIINISRKVIRTERKVHYVDVSVAKAHQGGGEVLYQLCYTTMQPCYLNTNLVTQL